MGVSMNASLEVTPTNARLLGLECYNARNLWTPPGNRGVFGGQVIAQALLAAINTVQGMDLHSQHAYFLLPCDSSKPVTYAVERLREGKSYSTRLVHAIQDSETIFTLTASFALPPNPEHAQGIRPFRREFPDGVKSFDEAFGDESKWRDYIATSNDFGGKVEDTEANRKAFFEAAARGRPMTAVQAKPQHANVRTVWLQPHLERPFASQNEIRAMLAYITDTQAIATAGRTIGLSARSTPALGMLTTLDHTLHFYPLPEGYDGSQPVLHVMESQIVDLSVGRGCLTGRVYTRDGVLIATTSQEGVVRARAPGLKPKLLGKM